MERAESKEKHKHRQPAAPPPRKYVSVFRIDGAPIMPPLMTTEKRRQMLKIKEKAVKIEQKWEEKQRKKLQFRKNLAEVASEPQQLDTPRSQRSSNCSSCSCGSSSVSISGGNSQRSFELEVAAARQQQQLEEDSFNLLSNLMYRRENIAAAENVFVESSTSTNTSRNYTESQSAMWNIVKRMQKLQKSETIIYDNCSNTVIVSNLEETKRKQLDKMRMHMRAANDYYDAAEDLDADLDARLQKSAHLSAKQIPAIFVDPPTPLAETRSLCDPRLESASADTFESPRLPPPSETSYSVDMTSEDSFGSSQSSPPKVFNLKTQAKITNIPARLSTRSTLTPCEMKPPQRSATSPQLQPPMHVKSSTPTHCLNGSSDSTATANPLVRSNSFTLDCPSNALLEHIRKQKEAADVSAPQSRGSPSANAIRDTVESKAKRVQKVVPKTRTSMPMRSQTKHITNAVNSSSSCQANSSTSFFKNKHSPYELKTNSKMKLARSFKKNVPSATGSKQLPTKCCMPATSVAPKQSKNAKNVLQDPKLLNEFELEHRQKFLKLIAQQQEEQKRMQQSFEAQQQQLLQQLAAKMTSTQLSLQSHSHTTPSVQTFNVEEVSVATSPNSKSEWSEIKSPTLSVSSSILSSSITAAGGDLPSMETSACSILTSAAFNSSRCTPRRRLFPHEHSTVAFMSAQSELGSGGGGGDGTATNSAAASSSSASRRFQQHLENAATKINACARGFLVRRLFQTEQVQRIVQTIRDTLIFVLNLHLETAADLEEARTPANIKLKARLLQQLTSASRTLYLVFFQTSIKERMEIIARDRKRIKIKLLTTNVKR